MKKFNSGAPDSVCRRSLSVASGGARLAIERNGVGERHKGERAATRSLATRNEKRGCGAPLIEDMTLSGAYLSQPSPPAAPNPANEDVR